MSALRALLSDVRVSSTGVAAEVVRQIADDESAPGLMDRLIHEDYGSSDANLHTFDGAAARLSGATLLTAST